MLKREHLRRSRILRTLYRSAMRLAGRPVELGMTSQEEQIYLIQYGHNEYKGIGEVVDLGCWLGSTTISLVKGLRKNPAFTSGGKRKVHAYDLFLWHPAMERAVVGTSLVGRYQEGESILDEFRRRTAKWSDAIEIYAGDICEIGWNGSPIEFLMIDAMKTWRVAKGIVAHFYTHLIPQKSIVVHQDFAHYYTSWIHLLQYRYRNHFVHHHDVPRSASTVFRYLDPIPDELLQLPFSFDAFSKEEIDAAFDMSFQCVGEKKHPEIAAAKVMTYIHMGEKECARQEFDRLVKDGLPVTAGLQTVKNLLDQASSRF